MNYEKLYARITDALVEKDYCVLEDAMNNELTSKLLTFAKKQNTFKQAGISPFNTQQLDRSKRRDKILWIDEDNGIQTAYLQFTLGLQNYLNKELYLGLTYHETHFAVYHKGDFYEKHLDAFKHSKNRVVSLVYYLNEAWNSSDAGELLIYNEKDELINTVIPKANTLIVFLSEKFPHEVLAAKKKRYSIAGWFRVDVL
ncbi:MAG: SM-20-related protein [uncultured Sulfurovum sp.]|uniref:SM-20-related protein n=1 Tax=uncultured Sulfurovum sp. TaxID=269237 RepID=A0A6S6T5A8_9BACT|nr:MAG: SM-20-related protein [uncultured Sulfurovum sp.]